MVKEIVVPSEFISLSEAARQLDISRPTLYVRITQGLLTRYSVGGEARVLRAEVERLKQQAGGRPKKAGNP